MNALHNSGQRSATALDVLKTAMPPTSFVLHVQPVVASDLPWLSEHASSASARPDEPSALLLSVRRTPSAYEVTSTL